MLVKDNELCRLIEKGSRVSVTISKAMSFSLPEQRSCHFSSREGENIDVGTANIGIEKFLLTQEALTTGAEMTFHFDLDQNYMFTVRACANVI